MSKNTIKNFNIRVYGILIEQNKVLFTREVRSNKMITKFPGGGLEKGEGIEECLRREFNEEFGVEIEVIELYYINEFFQQSAFSTEDQLISIYYKVKRIKENLVLQSRETDVTIAWCKLNELSSDLMTFPVDKVVANKISS